MSAIAEFDAQRRAAAAVISRRIAADLLEDMAAKLARCKLPINRCMNGWGLRRLSKNSPLVITDLRTGIVHARSTKTNPSKLATDFEAPAVGAQP